MSEPLREDPRPFQPAPEVVVEGEGARGRSQELRGQIDKLQGAVDAASGQVRNNYLSFLLFGLYLAIIFGSTTHEQLLRETPVTLPILNVGLPLVPFYWVAPALFVLLHFNLLMQLYLLAGKLKRLDDAITKLADPEIEAAERARLGIFTFSHMLIGEGQSYARSLPRIMAWTSVVILPVALLILGQIMFLPYHDAATTWFHRGLVFFDIVLLWFLWSMATDLSGRWRRRLSAFARLLRRRPVRSSLRRLMSRPHRLWGRHVSHREAWRPLLIEEMGLAAIAISLLVVTIPGGFLAWTMDRVSGERGSFGFPRNLVVRETNLVSAWPTQAQIDQYGEDGAWENFGQPIVLAGRDLRHGDFRGTNFTRADLRGGDLTRANLWAAVLAGANLDCPELGISGTLGCANLQGAFLGGANLQGAALSGANLQGAFLEDANLQGAALRFANLQGAALSRANLQGAALWFTNLHGANLRFANLQGADLLRANLQGADLRGAGLSRARDLETGDWSASDLRGIGLDSPTAEEMEKWREETEAIASDDVRERVLGLFGKLGERTSEPWTPTFGDQIEGKALFDPWLFDPESDDREGWLEPMPFHLYEPALAEHLIELACGNNALPGVVGNIARRALADNGGGFDEVAQPYAALVAKRMIDGPCVVATGLDYRTRARLRELAERAPAEE